MTPHERQRALERIASYTERRLRCGACDRWSDARAEGWRAYLGREDDYSIVTVVLCPSCSRRELG